MKLQPFKRIIKEDVEEQYRPLVDKLGYSINSFADDVINLFNKNIGIDDNLNQVKKDITITVDTTGKLSIPLNFKTGLKSSCSGVIVIKATNKSNSSIYPTSQPFVSWTEGSGIITINNISGLQANTSYLLKLLLLG